MKGRDELRKKWKEGDKKNKTIQTCRKAKEKAGRRKEGKCEGETIKMCSKDTKLNAGWRKA